MNNSPDKKKPSVSKTSQRNSSAPKRSPVSEGDKDYDIIMKKKYAEYRRKKQRQRNAIRISIALLIVAVITAAFIIMMVSCNSCSGNSAAQESAASDTKTSEASVDKTSAIEAVADSSKVIQEPVDRTPVYDNPHKYKVNTSRLDESDIAELDNEISAEFVALYDVTADEFIYLKNGFQKCYPASTTKMLTAIVSSQIITDPKTVITVGDEIKLIGWDSSIAGLVEGMQLTYEMLLDALMLPSGNDAAYTIAVNCGRIYKNNDKLDNEKAVKVFMELVNDCAKQIGASYTHYVTPDGWHDDNHYTSAHDLAVIGDYASTIPIVKNSFSKPYAEWELIKGGTLAWSNSNKLIQNGSGYSSEYCNGIKTGFTDEAGTSVVASATMNGHTLIASVMNGYTLYTKYMDCHLLFKKGFALYGLEYTTEQDYTE